MGSGNFLMDQLMGAHIYLAEDGRGPVVERVHAELTTAGKNPYDIPPGASNGIGSMGYVNAAHELILQWEDMGISPSHVFTASGSGGTQAGLLVGLRYFGNDTTQVIGISVNAESERMVQRTRNVIDLICDEVGIENSIVQDEEIVVMDQYVGEAYGRPSEAGIAAIRMLAEHEGIILDPVYTGKGMSGMLDLLQRDQLHSPRDVVFLHTGGAPAIHPYAEFFRT